MEKVKYEWWSHHGLVNRIFVKGLAAGQEILNKFSSKHDMVTLLLVYHKHLEIRPSLKCMTLGTDKKNHSHLSSCYIIVDKSEFCLISRLESFEAKTIWIQMGGAYLVTWTVLCFLFHTHWSLQHSKASCYFQPVAFCSRFMPSKPQNSNPQPLIPRFVTIITKPPVTCTCGKCPPTNKTTLSDLLFLPACHFSSPPSPQFFFFF